MRSIKVSPGRSQVNFREKIISSQLTIRTRDNNQENRDSFLWESLLFSAIQELKLAVVPRNKLVFSMTDINSLCETSPLPSLSASDIMSSISAWERSSSDGRSHVIMIGILWRELFQLLERNNLLGVAFKTYQAVCRVSLAIVKLFYRYALKIKTGWNKLYQSIFSRTHFIEYRL